MRSIDGLERWVLARGNFEVDAQGWAIVCQGIIVDITSIRDHAVEPVSASVIAGSDPLERAAEHCIAARREIDELFDPNLRKLIAPVLAELGRRIDLGQFLERQ